jgi:hypothetical protein
LNTAVIELRALSEDTQALRYSLGHPSLVAGDGPDGSFHNQIIQA